MLHANTAYPGYSWSLNQHIGRVVAFPETIFAMLKAAFVFSGQPNAGDLISNAIIEKELLPPNIRKDAQRPQIWRDYQQVLSEFGLIFSTRFTQDIKVTPIGMMWLDGLIGYSELLTTQAMRYQYPNGHKWQLSPRQKKELQQHNITVPDTRTILDAQFGVKIKPAVLVLRVLYELLKAGEQPSLNARECLSALVPIVSNNHWPAALSNLKILRKKGLPSADTAKLRHIQEWFRLLNFTDLFRCPSDGVLSLSEFSTLNPNLLNEIIQYHEDIDTFWYPVTELRAENAMAWFSKYGSPSLESQWVRNAEQLDAEYVTLNYPEGLDSLEYQQDVDESIDWNSSMALRDIDENSFQRTSRSSKTIKIDHDKLVASHFKRERNTLLHHRIVELAATKFKQNRYAVHEDPQSVDILAANNEMEVIAEIKTVTKRTLRGRLRLGVGQVSEYRYRRLLETNKKPTSLLVLSSTEKFPEWIISYFQNDIQIGLVSLESSDNFFAHTKGLAENILCS